jgi:hypothetical protein
MLPRSWAGRAALSQKCCDSNAERNPLPLAARVAHHGVMGQAWRPRASAMYQDGGHAGVWLVSDHRWSRSILVNALTSRTCSLSHRRVAIISAV